MVQQKKNLLIVGTTGSGKTTILNSLANCIDPFQRVVCIEDTAELSLPNGASCRLLTRHDPNNSFAPIDQGDLLVEALRMRPDRIIMGEIRGPEAKDLIMCNGTGHTGNMSTLHANDPKQALWRLEMLVQLGAPQWDPRSIRQMIRLGLDYIVVVEKIKGHRQLAGIYKLSSVEPSSITLDCVYQRSTKSMESSIPERLYNFPV